MRDIEGFEGVYAITDDGKVWAYPRPYTHNGKFLKPGKTKNGYLTVCLWPKGVSKRGRTYTIHSLVARTYLKNTNNLTMINHKDGNKLNNTVNNLEWCTPGENLTHAWATGLFRPEFRKNELHGDL